jgi:hypothetical protein
LKRNYLILNELKDSPALCFEKLCLGASWMMDRIKELLFSGGIAGSFCSWWLVFLQSHLKEFFWLFFFTSGWCIYPRTISREPTA